MVGIRGLADPFPVAAPACPAQIQVAQSGAVELIVNGNFETDTDLAGSTDYKYWSQGATTAGWSGTTDSPRTGIQKTSSNQPWCNSICEGDHIVYIQYGGALWQTVTLPADGFYRLSFSCAARPNYGNHEMQVFLDERELTAVTTTSTRWTTKNVVFRAAAGTYTLRFAGIDRGVDRATTLDCVSLKAVHQPAFGNLVANPGFEQGTTGIDGWKYFETETTVNYDQAAYAQTDVWVCSGDAGITQDGNTTWADRPHVGTYALFLQRTARAEQTITLPHDGLYRISFHATGRGGHTGHTVRAELDGVLLGEVYTDGRAYYHCEADFTATAGEHVFALVGVKNGDSDTASAVDEVVVAPVGVIENGLAHYDTLVHAFEYGSENQATLAVVADSDVEQSLELGAFAGAVMVENTTTATTLALPAQLPAWTMALRSTATLKLRLGSLAETQPVLNSITELPTDCALPLEISFSSAAETGSYALATSSLAETLAERLQVAVAGGAGHLEYSDGRLLFVVEGLEYMLWRPSSGADTWHTAAWLLNGVGDLVAFSNGYQAMFDGADAQSMVWLDDDVQV
ncbi:MAG: DUF642 domain-containing protein, partial [Kiritimatiellae bacterium]|nr:DUF642 domain-containing protein [Kiritimatiellia bacterium]